MLIRESKLTVSSYPYNYIAVDGLFDESTSYGLSSVFNDLIRNGRQVGKVGEVGSLIYEAINTTPKLDDIRSSPISKLLSHELKNWIAEIFEIRLDENLMMGMHRHNAPSRPGWTHTDFAIVSFPNIPPNFGSHRVYSDGCGVNYSDDSKHRQPDTIKTARAIACLYYTANAVWEPGMGGETGIYLPDGKTLVASVPPKNNTLFVFEISPLSFHAYLGSQTMQRNSFIWWYHSDPTYLLKRHEAVIAAKQRLGLDP